MQKNRRIKEKVTASILVICMMMSYIMTLSSIYVIYAAEETEQVIYNAEIIEVKEESTEIEEKVENNEDDVTEEEENVESKEETVTEEETNVTEKSYALKLTVGIKEKGYLKNAKIQIENLDEQIFNIIQIEHPIIQTIENGNITLNTIETKEEYEIEIPLEIKIEEKVNISNIQNGTNIKLTGTYVNEEGTEEKIEKTENAKIQIENQRQIQINSNVEKYIRYTQEEQEYALVQMKIEIEEKAEKIILPIKQTNLKITLPQIEVSDGRERPEIQNIVIIAKNTGFTNGKQGTEVEFGEENYNYENGNIEIKVENKEEDGKYRQTNGKDEYLVEITYNNAQNIENPEIKSQIEANVEIFNNQETKQEQGTIEQTYNLDQANTNKITYEIKNNTNELSKGNLYANVNKEDNLYETTYQNEIILNISKANSIKTIEIREQEENYKDELGNKYTTTTENGNETYYKTTTLNKENLNKIIGENGNLEILNEAGENLITINKDTETNEEGNIVLGYTNKIGKIVIRINNPEAEGILNIQNTKAIGKSNYNKEYLVNFTKLSNTYIATAQYDEGIITELGTQEIGTTLRGTTTKANIEINRSQLSTLTKNENIEFNINLNNSSNESDMYINPEFEITLPREIQDITIKEVNLLYGNDELKIAETQTRIDEENRAVIYIRLEGTQTTYSQGDIEKGTSIIIKTDLGVNMYTPNKEENVILKYVNPNATGYGSEIIDGLPREDLKLLFVGASSIVNAQRISGYEEGQTVMSMNQGEQKAIIKDNSESKEATMELIVINNGEEVLENPIILGRIAYEGNKTLIDEKDLETNTTVKMLTGIEKVRGDKEIKVYYSENGEATRELENPENGWTDNPVNLENIKSYLIVPNGNIEIGESLVLSYNLEIPENLELGTNIYGTFGTYFDTEIGTKLVEAQKVGLETEEKPEEVVEETQEENEQQIEEENTSVVDEEEKQELTLKEEEIFTALGVSNFNSRSVGAVTENGTEEKRLVTFVIEDSDEITNVEAGDEIKFKFKINNTQDYILKNVNVYVQIPDGLSYKRAYYYNPILNETTNTYDEIEDVEYDAESKKVTWNCNEIADYVEFVLELNVDSLNSETSKEVSLSANIVSDNLDKEYQSSEKKYNIIKPNFEINYSNSSGNKYVKVGDTIDYTCEIKNLTSKNLNNINIVSEFPQELEIIDASYTKGNFEGSIPFSNNKIDITTILSTNEVESIFVKCKVGNISDEEKVVNNYWLVSYNETSQKSDILETIIQKNESSSSDAQNNQNSSNGNSNVNLNDEQMEDITGDYKITGQAWVDSNNNGARDTGEKGVENVIVRLYNAETNGLVRKVVSDVAGGYILPSLPSGKYYAVYEYNTDTYSLTDYKKSGVSEDKNSDVLLTNGKSKTDTITIYDSSISNIDIGLIEGDVFDLSLEKTVSKITVQNNSGTDVTDCNDTNFAKVEIKAKDLASSTVYIEYKIKVTNNGQVAGTVGKIADYLPKDMTLSTELNENWYIGNDGYAYTEELANTSISPKETKEVTLIVSKAMTEENTGMSSNKAEISQASNDLGLTDIDSTPGNNKSGEDDLGQADVIISVSTGGGLISSMVLITIMINLLLAGYVIKRQIDKRNEVIL